MTFATGADCHLLVDGHVEVVFHSGPHEQVGILLPLWLADWLVTQLTTAQRQISSDQLQIRTWADFQRQANQIAQQIAPAGASGHVQPHDDGGLAARPLPSWTPSALTHEPPSHAPAGTVTPQGRYDDPLQDPHVLEWLSSRTQ